MSLESGPDYVEEQPELSEEQAILAQQITDDLMEAMIRDFEIDFDSVDATERQVRNTIGARVRRELLSGNAPETIFERIYVETEDEFIGRGGTNSERMSEIRDQLADVPADDLMQTDRYDSNLIRLEGLIDNLDIDIDLLDDDDYHYYLSLAGEIEYLYDIYDEDAALVLSDQLRTSIAQDYQQTLRLQRQEQNPSEVDTTEPPENPAENIEIDSTVEVDTPVEVVESREELQGERALTYLELLRITFGDENIFNGMYDVSRAESVISRNINKDQLDYAAEYAVDPAAIALVIDYCVDRLDDPAYENTFFTALENANVNGQILKMTYRRHDIHERFLERIITTVSGMAINGPNVSVEDRDEILTELIEWDRTPYNVIVDLATNPSLAHLNERIRSNPRYENIAELMGVEVADTENPS